MASVHVIEIEISPEKGPPLKTAGSLVVAVVPPRDDTFATVLINPSLEDYTDSVVTDDFEARKWVTLADTAESVTGPVRVGDSRAKHFSMNGVDYRITLQAVNRVRSESGEWPVYHFLVEGGEAGSADVRIAEREAIVREHFEAAAVNDFERVIASTDRFADFAIEVLGSPVADRRMFAQMLENKGLARLRLGNREGARKCVSVVQEIPNPERDMSLEKLRASALFHRASMNEEDDLIDEAIADYAEIDNRYKQFPVLDAMLLVMKSLMRKGRLLETKRGKHVEAMRAAETVIERYGNRTEPSVVEWVNYAREVRGPQGPQQPPPSTDQISPEPGP
jgi:hypothetical protein